MFWNIVPLGIVLMSEMDIHILAPCFIQTVPVLIGDLGISV